MSKHLIASVEPGKEDGMKPAWHGLSLCCLATALCLVACDGSSTPSDFPAGTSESAAGTPALVFSTPETGPAFSQEDLQAPAADPEAEAPLDPSSGVRTPVLVFLTPEAESSGSQEDLQAPAADPETAATVDPSSDIRTPVLIFFTPETEPVASGEAPQASATDVETAVVEDAIPGLRTPAPVLLTTTANPTNQQEFRVDAGTPGAQFTRIALPLTPAATIMPRPTGATAVPRPPTGSQASPASGETPFAQWPRGWCVGVGAVALILLTAWLLAWRRR
jgi:hypothetical protein